jgi:hypothetical protein
MGSIGRRTTLILREVERICANGNGTEKLSYNYKGENTDI